MGKIKCNRLYGRLSFLDIMIGSYFLLSPLEFALINIIPSGLSLKYLGLIIIIVAVASIYRNSEKIKFSAIHALFGLWLIYEIFSMFWTPSQSLAMLYFSSYFNITIFFFVLSNNPFKYRKYTNSV